MPRLQLMIRVLTMTNASARQQSAEKTLSESNSLKSFPFKFFFAVKHSDVNLNYDPYQAAVANGRPLSNAECSCYASHYEICKQFLSCDISDFLFVIEDDVFIDPNFDVEKVVEMMEFSKIDYMRLFCRSSVPSKSILYRAKYQIVRSVWSPGGTQAYLLSRKGAVNLVNHIERQGLIRRPIDVEMDRSWEVGNAVYALYPQPVLEFNVSTMIHSIEQINQWSESGRQVYKIKKLGYFGFKFDKIISTLRDRLFRKIYDILMMRNDKIMHDLLNQFFSFPAFNDFQR